MLLAMETYHAFLITESELHNISYVDWESFDDLYASTFPIIFNYSILNTTYQTLLCTKLSLQSIPSTNVVSSTPNLLYFSSAWFTSLSAMDMNIFQVFLLETMFDTIYLWLPLHACVTTEACLAFSIRIAFETCANSNQIISDNTWGVKCHESESLLP